ncbi:MAG: UDP-N-acetylmuramoyl-tripeptide--D-alanyl-D-alanine ligase [Defluviitaleaceae bacterium]|nr:UDP-N-acetylmuramoyl-tripeptide--D-alanyl-D-alanine ligase [Defluviitaleaceae bacterium]
MKPLRIDEVARAVGGRLNRPEVGGTMITGVSFDTRGDMTGKLFVPLKGNRDGHDFLQDAVNAGAMCVFSEIETRLDAIIVPDAFAALRDLAEYYRTLFNVKIVGITGSNGKTSAKDMVAAVLAEKYNVVKTMGNFNNEIGLPTTIFNIDDDTQVAVLEMGMNHRWEIHRLSKIARPNYAVITNIGVAHIENLGSQEEIFRAKSEIMDYMADDGRIFLNGDDPFLLRYRDREDVTFFGRTMKDGYKATNEETTALDGSRYTTRLKSGEEVDIYVPIPGRHMVMNSLVAVALGEELGLTGAEIAAGISKFKPSGMRMNIFETVGGIRIIDDCYNASPDSVKAALEVLCQAERNTMAILGDMYELGEDSHAMHYDVGAEAARLCIGTIICIGPYSEAAYNGAHAQYQAGTSTSRIMHFDSKQDCISQLPHIVKSGDTVLVKASRGMKFEEIVGFLSDLL